jgi:thioesterase domain-containing protein
MDARDLERYLHDRIPLSRAMAVEVRAAAPAGVTLFAPLAPNMNHRDTVFGGSASALAILAAWSALLVRLKDAEFDGRIVIQRNTVHYERPMAAAFTASASVPDGASWERLLAAIRRGRPGRIRIHSVLDCESTQCGDLEGEFVVLPPTGTAPRSPA